MSDSVRRVVFGALLVALLVPLSAFGQAVSSPATPKAAAQADVVRRLSVDEAVALALEQEPLAPGAATGSADSESDDRTGEERRGHPRSVRPFQTPARPARSAASCLAPRPNWSTRTSASRSRKTSSCRGEGRTTTSPGPTPAPEQQRLRQPEPLARVEPERHVQPAAAPQFQDRQHASAVAHQQEEPRDERRAAPADGARHDPQREERLLGPGLRGGQPEGAAAVARHRPRIAPRQQGARGRRDDGADRHHRGRGRSGA